MKITHPLSIVLIAIGFSFLPIALQAQDYIGKGNSTAATPLPKPDNIEYIDLDNDKDPDIIKGTIFGDTPIMWIDDDDDMQAGDLEGDLDNDCLLVSRDKDTIFAGPWDLSIDRIDEDGDSIADMEVIMENYSPDIKNRFDWDANYIWNIDLDKDGHFSYINWALEPAVTRGWEHDNTCAFYNDYLGQTIFTKMSISSFRISDFRYSWECPFLFYDYDNDGYSEAAIRLVDHPIFKNSSNTDLFKDYPDDITVIYHKKIQWASLSYDLDNNNRPGYEFDLDMTLNFSGEGFDYSDQVHPIQNTQRDTLADKYFYDSRWREVTELIYPDHDSAHNLVYNRGDWNQCWFVFDEDNDCNRWERVELYQPKDPFKIGMGGGGIDNNNQADAAGDRGEWDNDNSGHGKLYVGKFDGLLHLYGAEWGCWRMDPFAESYQGYGGLYDTTAWKRLQTIPSNYATVKYTDSDNNGFIDKLEFDLDSNKLFERTISLTDLSIGDEQELIHFDTMSYASKHKMFEDLADSNWVNAQKAIPVALEMGIDTSIYRFLMNPESIWEKYYSGYWLNFNVYNDLRNVAVIAEDTENVERLDIAYFSRQWENFELSPEDTTTSSVFTAKTPLSLTVFPNPTNGIFSIDMSSSPVENYHIVIFDMSGKIVIDKMTSDNFMRLDISEANSGIYMIHVESETSRRITKIIKY